MSEFHFVAIILTSASETRDLSRFEEQLDRARDWVEFRDQSWLVWTEQTSRTWYRRMKPLLREGDNILVFAADMSDRGGLMPEAFWEFVRAKTS
ncbi:hypothetical protein [Rhizobium sp. BK376]|uniref:hypothetical protein n=1 Tax=Rhizobium sp. BK376 TaxID=2512149 RepID=UPI001053DF8B|nr:hypothetical protein [Rhizobium sp. BK376]